MVDYLFLVPLSPSHKLSTERKALQNLCFAQIKKLQASYRVFLLSAERLEIAPFELWPCKTATKEAKLREVAQYCAEQPLPLAKYVVRLDDDDLINPGVFDKLASSDFNLANDREHWFYDLSSGRCSKQYRRWIANTALHNWEHAFTQVPIDSSNEFETTNWLIACDHSKQWAPYYSHRRVVVIKGGNPLYLRVLNPQTITALAASTYNAYLAGFGKWSAPFPLDAESFNQLTKIWHEAHGALVPLQLPKKAFLSRIRNLFS